MNTFFNRIKKMIPLGGMLVLIAFTGCNKEPGSVDSPENLDELSQDNIAHQLAKMLAASTISVEGKNFIKEEVEKQFDGDYNFLFVEAVNKPVAGTGALKSTGSGETFGSFLSKYAPSESGLKSASSNMTALYKQLEEQYPLLQVAVPNFDEEAIKDWDNGEEPLVAILESDFDDQTTKQIVAYDSKGNIHYLDASIEPEKPVIVVSANERLEAVPKTNLKIAAPREVERLYYETDSYYYYYRDFTSPRVNTPSVGIVNPVPTTGCDRDSNPKKDYLNKAKFVDAKALRNAESWANGRPEVYVIVTYADKDGAKTLSKDCGSTGWCDFNWVGKIKKVHEKNLDLEIFTWVYTQMGDRMKYTFMESDASIGNVSFKTSISATIPVDPNNPNGVKLNVGGEASITIGKNDDNLKDAMVEYKDSTSGEGTKYSTGIIEFWVNQQ